MSSRVLFLSKLSPYPAEINYPELNTWGLFEDRYAYAVTVQSNTDNPADMVGLESAPMAAPARANIIIKGGKTKNLQLGSAMMAEPAQTNSPTRPEQRAGPYRLPGNGLLVARAAHQRPGRNRARIPDARGRDALAAAGPGPRPAAPQRPAPAGARDPEEVANHGQRPALFPRGRTSSPSRPKLSNLTADALAGTAQLFLLDARTQQPSKPNCSKAPPNSPLTSKATKARP